MVKGAGCDCASFVYAVYRACGLIPDEKIGVFHEDWFAHASQEVYMLRILRHAYKIAEAIGYASRDWQPGNIVLTRSTNSKIYNHGGIIVKWPRIIHAIHPVVTECDATKDELWSFQTVIVFDPWKKLEMEKIFSDRAYTYMHADKSGQGK